VSKKKTTEPVAEIEELVEPEPVVVDGPTVEAVLQQLRRLRPGPVTVTTTLAEAQETVVVEGHAFHGTKAGLSWRFDRRSFEMACRVAGWRVRRDGERWHLS